MKALEVGCENIRAVKFGPALHLSTRDKPGRAKAVSTGSFLGLNQGMRKDLMPFPGPMQQLQKATWETYFSLECLKFPSLDASAPLNYLIIVLNLLENHRIFLKGPEGHTIQYPLPLPSTKHL